MANCAFAADVPVNFHVVRRIGKRGCGLFVTKKTGESGVIQRISAKDSMIPEMPDITHNRHRLIVRKPEIIGVKRFRLLQVIEYGGRFPGVRTPSHQYQS
jgi:hypothetical protein